jgi:hypothetical protein
MAVSEDDVSKWTMRPIAELTGSALAWSTIVEVDGRKKTSTKKECAFCGKVYSGGPAVIGQHMDAQLGPRNVTACKPKADFVERHKQVLAELRRRRNATANVAAGRKDRDK